MVAKPSFFKDTFSAIVRAIDLPLANFDNGANEAGSCAPGIGINANFDTQEPGSTAQPVEANTNDWTLLDQFGNTRTPQPGSSIGAQALGAGQPGYGTIPQSMQIGTPDAAADPVTGADGTVTQEGFAHLTDVTVPNSWKAV